MDECNVSAYADEEDGIWISRDVEMLDFKIAREDRKVAAHWQR